MNNNTGQETSMLRAQNTRALQRVDVDCVRCGHVNAVYVEDMAAEVERLREVLRRIGDPRPGDVEHIDHAKRLARGALEGGDNA